MAKDVINVNGEERVVREDTAKSYRGGLWILGVVAMLVLGAVVLFFIFGGSSLFSGQGLESPGQIENSTRR